MTTHKVFVIIFIIVFAFILAGMILDRYYYEREESAEPTQVTSDSIDEAIPLNVITELDAGFDLRQVLNDSSTKLLLGDGEGADFVADIRQVIDLRVAEVMLFYDMILSDTLELYIDRNVDAVGKMRSSKLYSYLNFVVNGYRYEMAMSHEFVEEKRKLLIDHMRK